MLNTTFLVKFLSFLHTKFHIYGCTALWVVIL